jgi:hypothetical protein
MEVHRDKRRGHFVMDLGEVQGAGRVRGEIVACDLGSCLALTASAAYLTPGAARAMAVELTAWADRKHSAEMNDDGRLAEVADLLDLIEVEA